MVFHPFLDEILIGKIKGCSPEGVHGKGGPNSSDEAGSSLGRVARPAGLPSASVLGRRSGEGSDAEASTLSGKPGREGDTEPPRAQCSGKASASPGLHREAVTQDLRASTQGSPAPSGPCFVWCPLQVLGAERHRQRREAPSGVGGSDFHGDNRPGPMLSLLHLSQSL